MLVSTNATAAVSKVVFMATLPVKVKQPTLA
jgi:hypothetical protein